MKKILKLSLNISLLFVIYSCTNTTVVNPITPLPTPTPSSGLTSQPSVTPSDKKLGISFNGTVYDSKGNTVDGVVVSAKTIDPGLNWVAPEQTTVNGRYTFPDGPLGERIAVTITKDGVSKTRTEVLSPSLKENPLANTFDFNSFYTLDSTLIQILLFDINNEEVKEAKIKIESLDPNFTFSREYTVTGENILYTSSRNPLPVNTSFKITVNANGKQKERIIKTEASKIYNIISFGGENVADKEFAL